MSSTLAKLTAKTSAKQHVTNIPSKPGHVLRGCKSDDKERDAAMESKIPSNRNGKSQRRKESVASIDILNTHGSESYRSFEEGDISMKRSMLKCCEQKKNECTEHIIPSLLSESKTLIVQAVVALGAGCGTLVGQIENVDDKSESEKMGPCAKIVPKEPKSSTQTPFEQENLNEKGTDKIENERLLLEDADDESVAERYTEDNIIKENECISKETSNERVANEELVVKDAEFDKVLEQPDGQDAIERADPSAKSHVDTEGLPSIEPMAVDIAVSVEAMTVSSQVGQEICHLEPLQEQEPQCPKSKGRWGRFARSQKGK